MKVFISWSGDVSHKLALILRDWLPSVIQDIAPYVSSEDIDKGTRWATDISKELEASSFGILCVTKDNLEAPWLNFEAGALSKSFDKSRVVPFLLGVKRSEVQGPLLQFQSVVFERDDILKMLRSINCSQEEILIDETRIDTYFDVWWPKLTEAISTLVSTSKLPEEESPPSEKAGNSAILEEVLELVRSQSKLLRSPHELLPQDYIREVIPSSRQIEIEPAAIRDLEEAVDYLTSSLSSDSEKSINSEELNNRLNQLKDSARYILRRLHRTGKRGILGSLWDKSQDPG